VFAYHVQLNLKHLDCIAQTRQKQLEARAKGVTSTAESSMLDFAEKALLEQEKGVADDAKMEKLMGKLDLNGCVFLSSLYTYFFIMLAFVCLS